MGILRNSSLRGNNSKNKISKSTPLCEIVVIKYTDASILKKILRPTMKSDANCTAAANPETFRKEGEKYK